MKIIAAGGVFVEHIIAQKTGDRVTESYGTTSETKKPANQVSPSFQERFCTLEPISIHGQPIRACFPFPHPAYKLSLRDTKLKNLP